MSYESRPVQLALSQTIKITALHKLVNYTTQDCTTDVLKSQIANTMAIFRNNLLLVRRNRWLEENKQI